MEDEFCAQKRKWRPGGIPDAIRLRRGENAAAALFEDAGDPDFGLSGGMNQWDGMDSMGSRGSMGGMDGVPGMGGRNLW